MIRPPWLELAELEAARGVEEIVGPQHDARILAYHAATTLHAETDEVPWCAAFVCWCLEEAGFRSTRSAAARSFLEWGMRLESWAYGGVVVLQRGAGEQPGPERIRTPDGVSFYPGHVGFLVGIPTPREILVLGGNQANAINVRAYPRRRVLGVRWAV